MENASKALLIAATILLSILIIWLFVYIFKAGSSVGENYDKKQISQQLELYNSRFELYDRSNNTIMDLITVANLAYSINKQTLYDVDNSVKIDINIGNKKFYIPNEYNDNNKIEKNQIRMVGKPNPISIYDLPTLTFDELGIDFQNSNLDDKLSTTQYIKSKNETKYKYLFKCIEIKYEHRNGKVSYMRFDMEKNEEWE